MARYQPSNWKDEGTKMITSLRRIYSPGVMSSADGRHYAMAVSERWDQPLRDAWAVLTGRAVAFEYPKPGDLEQAIGQPLWDRRADRDRYFGKQGQSQP